MKKTEMLKGMKYSIETLLHYAKQEENGCDGLGNGPGLVNGLVVDKKERDKFLKTQKDCKNPLRQLDIYLKMVKLDLHKAILEEESE